MANNIKKAKNNPEMKFSIKILKFKRANTKLTYKENSLTKEI